MRNPVSTLGVTVAISLVLTVISPSFALEKLPRSTGIIEQHTSSQSSHLEEIKLPSGRSLFTHGPDPRPDYAGSHWLDETRPPVCATERYQHILYGHPFFQTSRLAEVASNIRAVVKNMNALLNKEAIESGNVEADFKVLCDETAEIRIDEFTSIGVDYESVFIAADLAGYNDPTVNYSMFFDFEGGVVCGVGSYYEDDSPYAGNQNNQGGGYALTYEPCWFGRTAMHENGHNMGAVQPAAPYSTGSGAHCYDIEDVMCYSPDGGDKNQTGTILRCSDRMHYDCEHDTYFDAEPEAGEYLSDHWNIGSRVNRFIQFGGVPPPPPPPPPPGTNIAPGGTFGRSCVNAECRFQPLVWDDDGEVNSVVWDFDDGARTGKRYPAHTYDTSAVHTVTMTVTDDRFASTSIVKTVDVQLTDPDTGAESLWNRGYTGGTVNQGGEWRYYKIQVPQGARDLSTYLYADCSFFDPSCAGGVGPIDCPISCSGDLSLYVKRGGRPSASSYDCVSANPNGLGQFSQYESCQIAELEAGYYYIGLVMERGGPQGYYLSVQYNDWEGRSGWGCGYYASVPGDVRTC